ncbi:restriction endonuclease [Gorillibacterium sp. sgz5001074]|uniref:restriction endonuclease n=1 Tax=Gorillibacterium sp. sgz5001074 TaxID=3446695 RepID=UPI003F670B09
MPTERKSRSRGLELDVSWMLGALVLLISNATIFKHLNASVGEPWLNLFLSGIILMLLGRISITFYRIQQEVKLSNSRIDRVDQLGQEEFALYMQEVYRLQGWNVSAPKPLSDQGMIPHGMLFRLTSVNGREAVAALHAGRRKLSKEYIAAASAKLQSESTGSKRRLEHWLVTNVSLTPQAVREASGRGLRLVDRKALIDLLAGVPAAPAPAPVNQPGEVVRLPVSRKHGGDADASSEPLLRRRRAAE